MENFQIYQLDIQARTGGDIYIGVVGPVRTGKSIVYPKIYGAYGTSCDGTRQTGRSAGSASLKRFRETHHHGRTQIYSERSSSRHPR